MTRPVHPILAGLVELLQEVARKEIIEPGVRDRGRQWFDNLQQAFPGYANAITVLARRSPEAVMSLIIGNVPALEPLKDNKAALDLIRYIQTGKKEKP